MISATDVPACPACGSREVHPVKTRVDDDTFAHTTVLKTLFACRGCGRDNTAAWESIQPAPEAVPVIGPPDGETIFDAAMRLGSAGEPDPLTLGIGAELKT